MKVAQLNLARSHIALKSQEGRTEALLGSVYQQLSFQYVQINKGSLLANVYDVNDPDFVLGNINLYFEPIGATGTPPPPPPPPLIFIGERCYVGCLVIIPEQRYDLPGGGKRMVMPSRGVRHTIVNGVTTYADGELVGASAGKVLRSQLPKAMGFFSSSRNWLRKAGSR